MAKFHSTLQSQYHYCHVLQQATRVYPIIFLNVCDQPARREALNLLQGNSNLHACFGYACHHVNLAKQFPACDNCIQKLAQNHPVTICNVCHNWTLPTATTALSYKEPLVDIVPA